MTAQAVVLQHIFRQTGGPYFNWSSVGDNPVNIAGSGIGSECTSGYQSMWIVAVTAIGLPGMH